MLMHARNERINVERLPFPVLASEKLDGWRCFVAGNELLTKTVGTFANQNLREHLADALKLSTDGTVFDGELWSPEMSLDEIQSILQSKTAKIPSHLKLYVFDVLKLSEIVLGRAARFERRAARLATLPRRANVVAHAYSRVDSAAALMRSYSRTIEDGGEGLVVRSLTGTYARGRVPAKSRIIWKIKPETVN